VEETDLFERMRPGEFPGGARVLRAKIDIIQQYQYARSGDVSHHP
jgi:hypothetical protein